MAAPWAASSSSRDRPVRQMWKAFQTFPPPPSHVIDTSEQTPDQTVTEIHRRIAAGEFVMG